MWTVIHRCCLCLPYSLLDFYMTCFFSSLRSGLPKSPFGVGSHPSLKKTPAVTLHHTRWLFFLHSSSYSHWWSHLFLGLQSNDCLPLTSSRRAETLFASHNWASLVAQTVKNPPAIWEIWVRSLDLEDPLEESMATHSSILAWRTSMDRGTWQAIVHRVTNSQKWLKQLSTHAHLSVIKLIHITSNVLPWWLSW